MADKTDRIMIFIDGSNLYHSLKGHFQRTDIDMGKFCQKLLEKRRLIRVYYYNARVGRKEEPERYQHQQTFFDGVSAIPYFELRLGRLVYINWPNSPPYEKGVDIQLTTDLLTHSFKNNYDKVEVALFGKERTSRPLREVADKVITIDGRLLRGCWK